MDRHSHPRQHVMKTHKGGIISVGLFLLICCLCGKTALAISLTATGNWSEMIDANDLVLGPGSDLIATYESSGNAVSLSVSGTSGDGDTWRLDIRKVDTNWHGDLTLSVRRTSDGTPHGHISGGTDYQNVDGLYRTFFSGDADISLIPVQFRVEGVSIDIPPGNYPTTVYFMVVDL